MAKNVIKTNAHPIADRIAGLFAQDTAAATCKVDIALLTCEGIVAGEFAGKPEKIGQDVYALSGAKRDGDNADSFKTQASKITAVVKAFLNFEDRKVGKRVMEDAATATRSQWNDFVGLSRKLSKWSGPAPSGEQIKALLAPRTPSKATTADLAAAAVKALDALAEATADAQAIDLLATMTKYRAQFGKTTAELNAEHRKPKTGADRIAELRAKANAQRDGAALN